MGLDGPDIRQFVTTAPPLAGDTEPKHTKTACIRKQTTRIANGVQVTL